MSGILGLVKGALSGNGAKIVETVGNLVDDATLSKEEKLKLINEHIEKLEAETTKRLEASLKDADSARNREIQISTSTAAPIINKIVTPILALSVIGLTFILFYCILFKGMKGVEKDILIYVLGALTTFDGMVLSYYFGSSSSSSAKQNTIEKILHEK